MWWVLLSVLLGYTSFARPEKDWRPQCLFGAVVDIHVWSTPRITVLAAFSCKQLDFIDACRHVADAWSHAVSADMDVDHIFSTRPNAIHWVADPTQPDPWHSHKDPTQPIHYIKRRHFDIKDNHNRFICIRPTIAWQTPGNWNVHISGAFKGVIGRCPKDFLAPKCRPKRRLTGCMYYCYLILRKITKFVATWCQSLRLKCTKFNFCLGSASDPTGGAYSASPDP